MGAVGVRRLSLFCACLALGAMIGLVSAFVVFWPQAVLCSTNAWHRSLPDKIDADSADSTWCSLRRTECAMEKTVEVVPDAYRERTMPNLPLCGVGDARGRWVFPCNESSAREAVRRWQPHDCRIPTLKAQDRDLVLSILKNRTLFVLGDSTLRGMMEKLARDIGAPGRQSNVQHGTMVFTLPEQNTVFHYAYYPPIFEPIIYMCSNLSTCINVLLNETSPVELERELVFAFFGRGANVDQERIRAIPDLLAAHPRLRTRKNDITVMIKSASPMVSLNVTCEMAQQNTRLRLVAKELGFRWIDTFWHAHPFFPSEVNKDHCLCHWHGSILEASIGNFLDALARGTTSV